MSRFSSALSLALERSGISQIPLSAQTGVKPAPINRYIRGRSQPTKDSLSRLLAAFPINDQAEMLRAYLHDATPEQAASLVDISTGHAGLFTVHEDQAAYGETLPKATRDALKFIASRAATDINLRDLLVDLHGLLEDKTPAEHPKAGRIAN